MVGDIPDAQTDETAPEFQLLKTVVLVGMMGSGKTAIGRALSVRLGVPFLDSDHEIETAANATIAEIFERDGEPFFRDREAEVIERLLKGDPCILSTGGGAFLAERNRVAIEEHGVALWLDVALPTLWERVRHKTTRPLLRTDDPRATLTALYNARNPTYALADLSVSVAAENSIDETTSLVVSALLSAPGVLEDQRD